MRRDRFDHSLLCLARTRGHTPAAERIAAAYSRLGEHGGCWIVLGSAGALLARRPEARRTWWRGVKIVIASYAGNQALKFTVRRRRPELDGLPPLTATVSNLSFPSAHTTTSFAAARAYRSVAPARALYAAAALFAISRPYLGVHYPSDVLAGAVLGTAIAEVAER